MGSMTVPEDCQHRVIRSSGLVRDFGWFVESKPVKRHMDDMLKVLRKVM